MHKRALTLTVLLLLSVVCALATSHVEYSEPRAGFSASISVSVDDTAVYRTGYVSENGSQWTAFNLTGTKSVRNWEFGPVTADINLTGVRYVAIFSCTWNDGWDCSETWQVKDRGPQSGAGTLDSLQGDYQALQDLYASTNGGSWTDNTGWSSMTAQTMGDAFGIQTDADGRVTRLDLFDNNLQETLPESIGNLKRVEFVNIKHNKITGALPASIGNLESVVYLLLAGPAWSDPRGVPGDGVNHYPSKVDWNGNKFSGSIPSTIGNLPVVEYLDLSRNRFEGTPLPTEIGNLQTLRGLYLNFNGHTGELPESWGNLVNLQEIQILSGPHDYHMNDPYPDGYEYYLTGEIPTSWGNMTALRYVWMNYNAFTGAYPAGWKDADELRSIYFRESHMDGFPQFLQEGEFPWFRGIRLEHSGLQGPLPDICHLNLGVLGVSNNALSGEIPGCVFGMSEMIQMNLNNNQFSGTVPDDLTGLVNIRNVRLSGNQLSGPLPTQWPDSEDYSVISLGGNNFSGPIPAQFEKFLGTTQSRGFLALWINDNQLSGELPSFLADFPASARMHLENNRFVFADLLPTHTTADANIDEWVVAPQKPFGTAANHDINTGESITLDEFSTHVTHADNQYQWRKDGTEITGATSREFTINSVQTSDTGVYTLVVANPNIPDLTLTSERINVQVTDGSTDSKASDEDALEALYVAANGDSWNDNTGWSSSGMDLNDDIYGVSVEQFGGELRVTEIDLRDNGLTGNIEVPELGNLKEMRLFAVYWNDLYSQIPAELMSLEELEHLYFSLTGNHDPEYPHEEASTGGGDTHPGKSKAGEQNVFYGSLPAPADPEDMSLKWLVMNWVDSAEFVADGISSVPPELFDIPTFVGLQIYNNNNIADLPFPDGICGMTNLRNLALGEENSGDAEGFLTGTIPACFGQLPELEHVRFKDNRDLVVDFDVLDMSDLQKVETFLAPSTRMRGSFPSEVTDGTLDENLRYFSVSWPNGEGMTSTLSAGANNIQVLLLSGHNLQGEIPADFWDQNSLINMNFGYNNFTSIGTDDLTHLGENYWKIRNLRWYNNEISGPWPKLAWGTSQLEKFTRFQVQNNRYVFRDMLWVPDNAPNAETVFELMQAEADVSFTYAPQKPFGQPATISADTGDDIVLDMFTGDVSHADNEYQWERDGSEISGATSRTLTLSNVDGGDEGTYRLIVDNPNVPRLTLQSEPVELAVN